MIKTVLVVMAMISCGCAMMGSPSDYRPNSSREKMALSKAELDITPNDVRDHFHGYLGRNLAWAGIIKSVQFNETLRTIQVAFEVEHRAFDWKKHGGHKPYRLSAEGEGVFTAGWTVQKPTSIQHLRSLADEGDMLLVYGRIYRLQDDVVQVEATAVRPIKKDEFQEVGQASGNASDMPVDAGDQNL